MKSILKIVSLVMSITTILSGQMISFILLTITAKKKPLIFPAK